MHLITIKRQKFPLLVENSSEHRSSYAFGNIGFYVSIYQVLLSFGRRSDVLGTMIRSNPKGFLDNLENHLTKQIEEVL